MKGEGEEDLTYPRPRPRGPLLPPTASSVDRSLSAPSFVSALPPRSKDLTSTVERERSREEKIEEGNEIG